MSDPFIGEVKMVSFNFAPKGWALCNGQLLAIAQNQALFSILGTTYGGNGSTNFALPNLQGRVPLHFNSTYPLGSVGGEATHTLVPTEIPAHTHAVNVSNAAAAVASPAGARPAQTSTTNYAPGSANVLLAPQAFAPAGNGQPHDNMSPYLVINFVIALVGIFPSRS